MPTKKRKYNARFPAGRIKKIMQTDEEVGKVAQAVPIIIYLFYPTPRTLELFVESLLSKAMQVTVARNAKTLSPSHVKQCILAESKFDFLRDLVKNIPDVSAAEEKEMMSAESSPNSSRFSDMPGPPRRIAREDSNSSSSSDVKIVPIPPAVTRDQVKRALSTETELPNKTVKSETVTSTSTDVAIDLSKKTVEEKPVVTANFYQETLLTDEVQHRSVITVNPSYTSPQPSTSYTKTETIKLDPVPKPSFVDKPLALPRIPVTPSPRTPITLGPRTPITAGPRTPITAGPRTPITAGPRTPITTGLRTPITLGPRTPITTGPRTPTTPGPRTPLTPAPRTPVTPILNIDFSKNLSNPEIKLLDTAAVNIASAPKNEKNSVRHMHRQNSKPAKPELKKIEIKPLVVHPVDIDSLNSGNLQIDEDYDT